MGRIIDLPTLITEVKAWLNDSTFTDDEIKGWIQMAESSFRRVLATLDNEATVTQVPADEFDTFPTGFNGLREAYVVSAPDNPLELISPAQMRTFGTLSGTPLFIAIHTGKFEFLPSAAGDTVSYTYFRKLDDLTDGSPTNYLILEFPDVYLGGTLAAAQKFLRDDVDVGQWILRKCVLRTSDGK